jgi:hypothetical protein
MNTEAGGGGVSNDEELRELKRDSAPYIQLSQPSTTKRVRLNRSFFFQLYFCENSTRQDGA